CFRQSGECSCRDGWVFFLTQRTLEVRRGRVRKERNNTYSRSAQRPRTTQPAELFSAPHSIVPALLMRPLRTIRALCVETTQISFHPHPQPQHTLNELTISPPLLTSPVKHCSSSSNVFLLR